MQKTIEVTLRATLGSWYNGYGCDQAVCSGPNPEITVTYNLGEDSLGMYLYESSGCYGGGNAFGKEDVLEYLRKPHPDYSPWSIAEMIAEVESL